MSKSAPPGKSTLDVEVTNVSGKGLWLRLDGHEVFAPFADFPWFEDASIRQIARIERPSHDHLYWPLLDIDLAVDSLHHPERYPLVSKVRPGRVREQPKKTRVKSSRRRATGG